MLLILAAFLIYGSSSANLEKQCLFSMCMYIIRMKNKRDKQANKTFIAKIVKNIRITQGKKSMA